MRVPEVHFVQSTRQNNKAKYSHYTAKREDGTPSQNYA